MTIRVDLTKRYDLQQPWKPRVLISQTPYGCADCGHWFAFAPQLVAHLCLVRGIDYTGRADA